MSSALLRTESALPLALPLLGPHPRGAGPCQAPRGLALPLPDPSPPAFSDSFSFPWAGIELRACPLSYTPRPARWFILRLTFNKLLNYPG